MLCFLPLKRTPDIFVALSGKSFFSMLLFHERRIENLTPSTSLEAAAHTAPPSPILLSSRKTPSLKFTLIINAKIYIYHLQKCKVLKSISKWAERSREPCSSSFFVAIRPQRLFPYCAKHDFKELSDVFRL